MSDKKSKKSEEVKEAEDLLAVENIEKCLLDLSVSQLTILLKLIFRQINKKTLSCYMESDKLLNEFLDEDEMESFVVFLKYMKNFPQELHTIFVPLKKELDEILSSKKTKKRKEEIEALSSHLAEIIFWLEGAFDASVSDGMVNTAIKLVEKIGSKQRNFPN